MLGSFQKNGISPVALTRFGLFLRRSLLRVARRAPINGMLELLGSVPLTAQSSLALVRLQNETLLLAISPQGVTLLTKVTLEERRKTEGACGETVRSGAAAGSQPRLPVFTRHVGSSEIP
jgi:flagellar biogenesis protein FliO